MILGRCGDYVLRERKDVLRVFIYAPVNGGGGVRQDQPPGQSHRRKGIRMRSTRPTATVRPTTTIMKPRTAGAMPITMTWR